MVCGLYEGRCEGCEHKICREERGWWACKYYDNTKGKLEVIAVKLFRSKEKAMQQYYLSKHLRNPFYFWGFPEKVTAEDVEKLHKQGVEIEFGD